MTHPAECLQYQENDRFPYLPKCPPAHRFRQAKCIRKSRQEIYCPGIASFAGARKTAASAIRGTGLPPRLRRIQYTTLAHCEAYRARLKAHPLGIENYEFARRERFILKEDRIFPRNVSLPHADRINT
jgi:hypothetical protein